jgi:hypothetical protein
MPLKCVHLPQFVCSRYYPRRLGPIQGPHVSESHGVLRDGQIRICHYNLAVADSRCRIWTRHGQPSKVSSQEAVGD